jgi:hypothetical protein
VRHTFSHPALLASLLLTFAVPAAALDESTVRGSVAPPPRTRHEPRVQVALLLDNSGSMQGLLNQARTQLWKVVNTFATAKQNGKPVKLELALYEYGNGVRRLAPLTSDLDAISSQLFGLQIAGGDEYCGAVIQTAATELEWSNHPEDLKLIYIAGNEPFTQGPITPAHATELARGRGITVNTIHCGGDEPTWREGARLGGGSYLTINQDAAVADVTTPMDAELARLGQLLNGTYVAYGASGGAKMERQRSLDGAASAAAPAAAAERAVAKASRNYNNAEWDLVDAAKEGRASVAQMRDEELPSQMRGMNAEQRRAYVEKQAQERSQLQKKIAELQQQRDAYLAAERKKASSGPVTLDTALERSIREHGTKKGMQF